MEYVVVVEKSETGFDPREGGRHADGCASVLTASEGRRFSAATLTAPRVDASNTIWPGGQRRGSSPPVMTTPLGLTHVTRHPEPHHVAVATPLSGVILSEVEGSRNAQPSHFEILRSLPLPRSLP